VYYFQYMRGQWLLSKVIDQTYQQGHPGASVVQWDWSNNTRTTYLTHDDGRHYYVKRVKMKSQSQYTLESFSGIPDR